METIDFIEIKPFRIYKSKTNWGAFVAIRFWADIRAEGGHITQQVMFNSVKYTFGILTALLIDLVILIAWALLELLKLAISGIIWTMKLVIKELIKTIFGKVLIYTIITVSLILIFTRWTEITNYITGFFDLLIKQ